MNPTDAPTWDREAAISVMAGDAEAAEQLFAMLLHSLPQQERNLQLHALDEDWDALWHLAHKLKGAASNLGAERLC
ncbi:MAG: Hpt domain-containing protein, partial [Gammaproteobacteria bacterium]|nr:Hpt domain-containing protein [Gammaproteobacteria bacterium]